MVDNTTVAVDTDNLADFELLLAGKATPAEPTAAPEAPVEPESEPVNTDTETSEDDPLAPSDGDELVDTDDDQEESPAFKLKPKKKTAQERIDEVIAKQRAAERERDELRAQLEAKEAAAKPEAKTETAKTVSDDSEPNPDDTDENGEPKYPLGEFDPKYVKDLTKHLFEKQAAEAKAEAEAARQRELEEQARAELNESWQEKLAKTQEVYPDLMEKGMKLENAFAGLTPQYGDYLAQVIMSLDNGPEVLYYLSDHLEEARALVAAGPQKATIGLGELNGMFKRKAETPVKVSKAPEPPVERARGTNGRFDVPDDTDDLEAFAKKFYGK